ncbi:hypothetical protein B0H21DRAFT_865080 [Amylocystis lapponica]|nr:hypothetical protein B0H21DRAFT_865080 [Amylocystis lapponica]
MSLVYQNSLYVSINVSGILYGVELMLYIQTIQELLKNKKHGQRLDKFFVCFSTATLALVTMIEATKAVFGQETWIVNATYPGGPAAYETKYDSACYQMLNQTAALLLDMLTNGLLMSASILD